MLIISVMIVAMLTVHAPNGFFAQNNGYELHLAYIAVAVILALAGNGTYSLDTLFGLSNVWTPALEWSAIGLGVLGGLLNASARRKPSAAQQPAGN
jgi:hypothetical protein